MATIAAQAILLLLLSGAVFAGAVVTQTSDAVYMQSLAAATGADRALNWSGGSDPCDSSWFGVTCTGGGRVLKIELPAQGLEGYFPGAASNDSLAQLKRLDLSGNSLRGALPQLLLPKLEELLLDGNSFTGIPPSFFAGMRALDKFSIANNSELRYWSLPPDLRFLAGLTSFQASNASINGSLPDFLGSTSPLYTLELANNAISGPVPEGFANRAIQKLDLRNNKMSGPISFIDSIPNAASIRLSNNFFSGPFPDFTERIRLEVLDVANNSITGVVPSQLSTILPSGSLSLSGNLLQGPVPEFSSKVKDDAAEAARTGCFCRLDPGPCDPVVDSLLSIAGALHFPVILAASWRRNDPCAGWLGVHCSGDKGRRRVTGINLSRLALNGTMDPAFASIMSLEAVLLSGNNITGDIPPAIAKLPSLRALDVSNNALVGKIPRFRNDVEVWAEGNHNLHSVSPAIMKHSALFTLIVAILALAV